MKRYLIKRLLYLFPVLLGATLTVFIAMRALPGDVALSILTGPGGGSVNETQYQKLRAELGLNRPLFVDVAHPSRGSQYGEWVWGVLRGDWGRSLQTQLPIREEIARRFPLTFETATLTLIISVVIAVPMGIVMAIRQDSLLDYSVRIVSLVGLAMPTFWTGALILLVLSAGFHWLPPLGYQHFWDSPWNNVRQVIWSCLALGYLLSAVLARMTRSTLLEVLREDYLRTAWAKGLPERVVILRHALKNSLLPVISLIGVYYAALIGGTVVMESLWNLPGLGKGLVDAIHFRDYPMVQGLVLVFALIVVAINLLIDLTYAWLDPRIRISQGGARS